MMALTDTHYLCQPKGRISKRGREKGEPDLRHL